MYYVPLCNMWMNLSSNSKALVVVLLLVLPGSAATGKRWIGVAVLRKVILEVNSCLQAINDDVIN